jgi:predicted N-acyltransferase
MINAMSVVPQREARMWLAVRMELVDDHGITIATVSAEEAVQLRQEDVPPHVTLLRVPRPPEESWTELAALGYVRKPAVLAWVAPAGRSLDEFLLNMPLKARQDMRRARRRAEEQGLRFEVEQPVDPDRLDQLLKLYDARVRTTSRCTRSTRT